MTMNGSRTNARRRVHAPASSASKKNSGVNESVHSVGFNGQNKDGRRRKSNEPKFQAQVSRFVRRKGKNISRIKRMCSKIGQLRIIDVALFAAIAAKIGSVLYSRRVPSSFMEQDVSMSTSLDPDSPTEVQTEEGQTLSDSWHFPEWVKRWKKHQMPFHSPLLYRREDDDYSFGLDSYLDDDGDFRSKQKNNMRFKGMFRTNRYYSDYKEQLNSNGYTVVDDILYNADNNRDSTLSALNNSEFQVNLKCILCVTKRPAFEFPDNEEDHRHYIDDDDWDPYYSHDDDIIRGTLGLGDVDKKIHDEEEHDDEEYDDEEYEEEEEEEESDGSNPAERDVCTRPSYYQMYYPTCNEMHASLSGYHWLIGEEVYSRRWKKRKHFLSSVRSHLSKYLSHGYYRDAFLFKSALVSYDEKNKPSTQWEKVVFKTMRHLYKGSEYFSAEGDDASDPSFAFDPKDKYTFLKYQDYMRKDALVMELLSSSPRAIDIYSHCSMSSVIEFAPTDIEEHIWPTMGYSPKKFVRRGAKSNKLDEPLNDHISPEEKLETALEMAKCIAAMHGLEYGPIANVDVQVGQFFRGRDGFIKIVDYNRAEPLLYDTKNEKYCKWTNGLPGDGTYRSPEENLDAPLTEKIDVYSLGNVFFALLTGKRVWEDYDYDEKMHDIGEGIYYPIPDVYSKSPISRLLVRAIESCWTYDVEERPSIFRVVDFLEQAVAKYPVTVKSWG